MRITDLLNPQAVVLDLEVRNKNEAIETLASALTSANRLFQVSEIQREVLQREADYTTAVGQGLAFPHAMVPSLERSYIAFGRSEGGIGFDAPDGQPVHLIFLLVGPAPDARNHLMTLATLSRLLSREGMRKALMNAKCAEEVIEILEASE